MIKVIGIVCNRKPKRKWTNVGSWTNSVRHKRGNMQLSWWILFSAPGTRQSWVSAFGSDKFEDLIWLYVSHSDCRKHHEQSNKISNQFGSERGENETKMIFYTHLIATLIVTRKNACILIESILTVETEWIGTTVCFIFQLIVVDR